MRRSVLIVDDEDLVRDYITDILSDHGFECIPFASGRTALNHLVTNEAEIALIVSDIGMPGMNGIEFLGKVRSIAPGMPFVLLSGMYDQPMAIDAYRTGATDYLLKPVTERDLIGMVGRHFETPDVHNGAFVRRQAWDCLVPPAGASPAAGDGLARVRLLFEALGCRRFETLQHSQRVAAFSRLVGVACGLSGKELQQLETGALLHDIGKVAIPQNVLEKPGRLNAEEWRVMKLHPAMGADLLAEIPDYAAESDIVLCHHERFDGGGYPNGLSGVRIPIGARIFAVADTLDAICSVRPYRQASSLATAHQEIDKMIGSQFDPFVVEGFKLVGDAELRAIQHRYAESESEGSLFSLAAATDRPISADGGVTARSDRA